MCITFIKMNKDRVGPDEGCVLRVLLLLFYLFVEGVCARQLPGATRSLV